MKNYKPFKLNEALKGKPVLYIHDEKEYKVTDIAKLKNVNKVAAFAPSFSDSICSFEFDGFRHYPSNNRLVMAPDEEWVNIYYRKFEGDVFVGVYRFDSKEKAIKEATNCTDSVLIATINISEYK